MNESSAAVKLCECGCGTPVSISKVTDKRSGTVKGQPVRFRPGHANQGRRFERKHPCIGFGSQPCENLNVKPDVRCAKCSHRYYLETNRERDRARNAARTSAHYQANRDVYVERTRQWRLDNPERARENSRRLSDARRARLRISNARWLRAHPEAARAACSRRRVLITAGMSAMDRELSVAYRLAIVHDLCFYCGDPGTEDDHYQSLKKGGTDHWWNLVRACRPCNARKNAMHGDEFLELLRSRLLP
jgi:5-methylcytosine-specific restriction endonuclease McrA